MSISWYQSLTSTLGDHVPAFLLPFIYLSYPTDTPSNLDSFHDAQYYKTGPLDACFIVACIAVMAVLRDATRLGIMEPFARWKLSRDLHRKRVGRKKSNGNANGNGHCANGGVASMSKRESSQMHRSVLRFAEQGWSVLYYAVQWTYGLYVHRSLPTRILNPIDIWLNHPHYPLPGPLKFYYLTQTAFYMHQVLILNAEARRKDHVQMMTHHVITILLMAWSYFVNLTRVGCLIMVLMDFCDIFLPLAKMFRYLALSKLCDATFVWFLLSWFVTRHVLFNIVIKSVYYDWPKVPTFEWAPERGFYFSTRVWVAFLALLLTLQVLQIIWFGMICRVAWRVVSGGGASDDRSDCESGDEEERKTQ